MSPTATTSQGNLPQLTVQGIAVPQGIVDPQTFAKGTRRQRFQIGSPVANFAGFGNSDSIEARKSGILASMAVKFTGSLVVTPGTGTVATTSKWPLDLPKRIKVSVNGGSFIINASGAKLRARKFMAIPGLTDRGVPEFVGGASPGNNTTQGTLALGCDSWGVGQNVTGIPAGTYNVELVWDVPIAWDDVTLLGSLFLQTSATSVEVTVDWAPQTDLFALTGNAAVTLTGGWFAEANVYDIPQVGGNVVLPDLSVYHTILQSNTGSVSQTANEIDFAGQGVGKSLQRVFGQIWNNTSPAPGSPLAVNRTNYGALGWMYGGNQQPETWTDGSTMRADMEESYGVDFGPTGFFCFDFAKYWSMRDSVNEGDATELRALLSVNAALTNPRLELVQETIVSGAMSG
ncbi:MAG: hypothetical protein JWM85_1124 [Acidimicrobiaceae bacterium]|nr:hypothetical protein [Acidimicrobiaceae bacterium]